MQTIQADTNVDTMNSKHSQPNLSKHSFGAPQNSKTFNEVVAQNGSKMTIIEDQNNVQQNSTKRSIFMNEPVAINCNASKTSCQINQLNSNQNSQQNIGSKNGFLPAQQIQSKHSVFEVVNENPCDPSLNDLCQNLMTKMSCPNVNTSNQNTSKMSHFSNQNPVDVQNV